MKTMILFYATLWLAGSSCISTKITSTWKTPGVVSKKYSRILVLGLIRESDRSLQMNMEDHVVGDLSRLGYNAVSSVKEYGPKAFENMDEVTALKKIKGSGIDGVLTIVLLNKEKERKYVPGHVYYSPYGYYSNRFWSYRTTLFLRVSEMGYYITDTKYFWESNFYDMQTQQLLYSVQTQSFDPSSTESMGHQYGQIIVKDMTRQGLLK